MVSRLVLIMDKTLGNTLADSMQYDRLLLCAHVISLGASLLTFTLLHMLAPHEQALFEEQSEHSTPLQPSNP